MCKKLILAMVLLVSAHHGFTQEAEVKGLVVDTLQKPMSFASVVLLQASDSVIHQFGITDDAGNFSFKKVPFGDYILQLSFVGFEDYSKLQTVQQKTVDFGTIAMQAKLNNLNEFVVEENLVPIKIIGDTVEYTAKAFKTRPNAAVEDLLKKLPGVQVDKEGNIKAQGEEVKKVFVDGKEFFGDDPKIATKNLPADAIDKVQVYDRKSEDAEFTGVDDGFREKAINLKLKEDKKHGMFGKVGGGVGTNGRFKANTNINKFDKKSQFSTLGMTNNINETGFSIQDYISFMGGISKLIENGGRSMATGIPLQMPGVSSGISTTSAAGVNFNKDLTKKTELFSNYFFNGVNANLVDETNRNTFYENLTTTENTLSDQESKSYNHRLNFNIRSKPDSLNEIKIKGSGTLNRGNIFSNTNQTLANTDEMQNISDRENTARSVASSGDLAITHRHKFAKKGRSSNVRVNANFSKSDGQGLLLFNSIQSMRGVRLYSQNLHQFNLTKQNEVGISSTFRFTEPLGKGHYLNINGEANFNDKLSRRLFFDEITGTELLGMSREFMNTYQFANTGVSWKKATSKSSVNIGLRTQVAQLSGQVIGLGDALEKQFTNLLPFVSYNNNKKTGRHIYFNYQTSTNVPTVDQLQPIIDNSDPQRPFLGNPDLKQEYVHTSYFSYRNYDQFTFSTYNIGFNASYTEDKITNQVTIDENFIQTTQPINTDENYNMSVYGGYAKEIKIVEFGIDLESDYSKGILFANNLPSITHSYVQMAAFEIGNRKKEKFDLVLGTEISQNRMEYENNLKLNNIGYQYVMFAELSFDLKKKWGFDGTFDYTIYKNDILQNQSFPMVKASLSRFLFENDRGELKLSVFDALNQNLGINFSNNLNYTQTSQTNVLNRYFMVSFIYSLSKFGGEKLNFDKPRRMHK